MALGDRGSLKRAALTLALAALALVPGSAARPAAVPPLGRVVVIVFENMDLDQVVGSPDAPIFTQLARSGASLRGYRGITHPSLPNYLALVSGSTQGISSDCTRCTVAARSLADTLEASGRTWKTYAEGLPRPGWTGPSAGRYVKRHNPFLYFRAVLAKPGRRARVVPLTALRRDLAAGALPDFSLVVPDVCHDMHDCPVATGDAWLENFLPPLLASPQLKRGVVFVVFDESAVSSDPRSAIPALALGPAVRPGSRSTAPVTHYSLLRTIEDDWGLPRLGRSASAAPILGIWR